MNKQEIVDVLSEKSSSNECIYCKGEIKRGYYAEADIGKMLIFPRFITKPFIENEVEKPVHYRCVEPLLFDMLREGGTEINETNTKILIRY